jgi:hypothetical protein
MSLPMVIDLQVDGLLGDDGAGVGNLGGHR